MFIAPRRRPVPVQDPDRILLHATRFRRAADALATWSARAKKAVDYFEGRQWAAADLAKLAAEKRPALTFNMIRPLVNLVLGYHLQHRSESKYLPGYDGIGTDEIAACLNLCDKQSSEAYALPFVDAEVFLDGLLTGRGFYDTRLCFRHNILGETCSTAHDPFSTYIDPDADEYDPNSGTFIAKSRWASPEELVEVYGPEIASLAGPFMQAGGVRSGMPLSLASVPDEISPLRRFAQEEDDRGLNWSDYFHDFIDGTRQTIRVVVFEHYVRTKRWFFVDLETGTRRPVPDHFTPQQVERTVQWAATQGAPVVVMQDRVRRLRETHLIGDIIAWDDWSPWDSMTLTPFYPYFRRGTTQGMVEHLTDAQDEKNRRRSARLNIIGRSANGGWIVEQSSLDAQQTANLEKFGSTPGVIVKYDSKGGKLSAPQPIQPSTTPVAMAQLEHESEDDLKAIAGINDAALGLIDQAVVSGAAIERRQRQTVVGLEHNLANFRRTKELLGRKRLELYQAFYREERILRLIGPGGTPVQKIINQRTAAGVVNDLSLGTYGVAVDETPLSASYQQAQFEELLSLAQMGVPVPDDFLVDASSIARKTELKVGIAAARATQPPPDPEQGPGPGGSRVGLDGGSLRRGTGAQGGPPAR